MTGTILNGSCLSLRTESMRAVAVVTVSTTVSTTISAAIVPPVMTTVASSVAPAMPVVIVIHDRSTESRSGNPADDGRFS